MTLRIKCVIFFEIEVAILYEDDPSCIAQMIEEYIEEDKIKYISTRTILLNLKYLMEVLSN